MGRMKLLSNIINNATNQVEGFCIIKNVQLKVNVKGAEYLDFTLADAVYPQYVSASYTHTGFWINFHWLNV